MEIRGLREHHLNNQRRPPIRQEWNVYGIRANGAVLILLGLSPNQFIACTMFGLRRGRPVGGAARENAQGIVQGSSRDGTMTLSMAFFHFEVKPMSRFLTSIFA